MEGGPMRDLILVVVQLVVAAIVGAWVGIKWHVLAPGLVLVAGVQLVWRYPWPPASRRWGRAAVLLRRRLLIVLITAFPIFVALLWSDYTTIAGTVWGAVLGFGFLTGMMMSAAVCPRCHGR